MESALKAAMRIEESMFAGRGGRVLRRVCEVITKLKTT
jgi:hypothetical protein